MRTAIRTRSTARRAERSARRRWSRGHATGGRLGAHPRGVTPARSPGASEACAAATRMCPHRVRRSSCGWCDVREGSSESIVMPPSSPRNLGGATASGPGGPQGAPRRPPTPARRDPTSVLRRRSGEFFRARPDAFSPVPVAHRPLLSRHRSRGRSATAEIAFGGVPENRVAPASRIAPIGVHQFQLRIAASFPVGRRRAVPSPVVGGCGPGAREGRRVSISPPAGGSVIICRPWWASAAPPSSGLPPGFLPVPGPRSGDTSVVTRLLSAQRGVEPRMNGRAVDEVRGCAAVTA